MSLRVGVIGAGISGLAVAQILKKNGHTVKVFEAKPKPGGLIACDVTQGHLFHRVGGHVFNSKEARVTDWFWSFFKQDEFLKAKRDARILMGSDLISYPIENNLFNFSSELIEEIVSELLHVSEASKDPLDYANLEEFLLNTFGKRLCELYFFPYNKKIWQTELSNIPMSWLKDKLPMPSLSDILTSNIARLSESKMVHSSFYYPRSGGSQFIVDRLSEGLDITCDEAVSEYFKVGGLLEVAGEQYDRLIFTGNIRQLLNPTELSQYESSLRSNSTTTALCKCDPFDYSWVYLPSEKFRAHRIINTGGFSESNRALSEWSCTLEFSGQVSDEQIKRDVKKLPFNLQVIDTNYEPHSYVIHSDKTTQVIKDVRKKLRADNVYLLGRFAEWEYYNMDTAISAAMKLVEMEF